MESTEALLKGTGSSSEDVDVGRVCHYPSLETVEEGQDAAIRSFKAQNPEETKFLVEEVDQILSKSIDKVSDLMDQRKSDGSEPVLLSFKPRDEDGDGDLQKQQELVLEPNASGIPTTAESGINTTFTIYPNEAGKSGGGDSEDAAPSPVPVLSEAPPTLDGKGPPPSTDPNHSVVFEVPGEDPTLELESFKSQPHQTVSEASTLFEALSVQYIPSDNSTHQKSSDVELKDKDSDVVYENSEDERMTKGFIAETESEVDSEENCLKGKRPEGPVELLTLHFPSTAAASVSHQETNLDGGDQPYIHPPVGNNNSVLENDITGSGHPSPATKLKDYREDPNYDTESDCPWLPKRVESLTKVISRKEKQDDSGNKGGIEAGTSAGGKQDKKGSMKRSKRSASTLENNLDETGQGCNCAKMCVVM